ncbi:MAG TPA: HAD-IA family hydrolase [Clostridiaceae bacterium]|nr:HAD-IA family hydrolase [Clostridiaceae bacterium]
MIKYLIFDFDGTVVDSAGLYIRLANNIADELGLPKLCLEELRSFTSMPIKNRCKILGIPLYRLPAMNIRMQEEIKNHIHELQWIDGIENEIRKLKESGFKLVIISSNSISNIERFFENKNLDVFDEIYSSKGIFDKHSSINKLIKKLGIKKDEAVYIGDEYRDIKACKKSKVRIISVTWGFDSEELLVKGNPDFIARTPQEMIDIIYRISGVNMSDM